MIQPMKLAENLLVYIILVSVVLLKKVFCILIFILSQSSVVLGDFFLDLRLLIKAELQIKTEDSCFKNPGLYAQEQKKSCQFTCISQEISPLLPAELCPGSPLACDLLQVYHEPDQEKIIIN